MMKPRLIIAGTAAFECIRQELNPDQQGGIEHYYLIGTPVQPTGYVQPNRVWVIQEPSIETKVPTHMKMNGLCDLLHALRRS